MNGAKNNSTQTPISSPLILNVHSSRSPFFAQKACACFFHVQSVSERTPAVCRPAIIRVRECACVSQCRGHTAAGSAIYVYTVPVLVVFGVRTNHGRKNPRACRTVCFPNRMKYVRAFNSSLCVRASRTDVRTGCARHNIQKQTDGSDREE